ncbi:class I SAM-dependent methyltransferase [Phycicoccus ginsengisoli]
MMFGLAEEFEYVQCDACATLYIARVPQDLADYYSTKYYSFDMDPEAVMGRPGVAQAVRALGRSVIFGRDRLAPLARRIPVRQLHTTIALFETVRLAGLPRGRSSAVLDVGCGSGALVYALSLVGVRTVHGVDPFNEGDREFRTGACVLSRGLEEVEETYDLIMLHHSLEHVPDPRATLAAARTRLREGGRVLVRMPTVSSEAWDRYGNSWMQLDPPRHLTVFSRPGMEIASTDAGLRVVAEVDDSTSFQFWASEQARAGIPLAAGNSHFLHPDKSSFTAAQIRAWEREAQALNAQRRGDQVAWVLEAA